MAPPPGVRSLVEAVRIGTPHALIIAGATTVLDVMPDAAQGLWWNVALDLTFAGRCMAWAASCSVVLLKWLLIGQHDRKPCPCGRASCGSRKAITLRVHRRAQLPCATCAARHGCPWPSRCWAPCGPWGLMDTTDITEFDCVTLGDHAELNALTCPQTHLFEDRAMKIDHVHIGQRANLGRAPPCCTAPAWKTTAGWARRTLR